MFDLKKPVIISESSFASLYGIEDSGFKYGVPIRPPGVRAIISKNINNKEYILF